MPEASSRPVEIPERRLAVRLAQGQADVVAAQRLRYDIFFRDMGAQAGGPAGDRDVDPYDMLCDHLLVEDHARPGSPVVGTYRLLRQSIAEAHDGFYSAHEFDLSAVIAHGRRTGVELLELGRSCVDPAYRDAGTIQLLWRGIADYLQQHRIGYMFGCASFPGIDPVEHAEGLSFLAHDHLALPELRARAIGPDAIPLGSLAIGGYDPRLALRRLPPLIKAYLRVGAQVGEGAYIDRAFNTIDVFVLMPVARIASRYAQRFEVAA
ncbi:GNAT family N-acetyltransferase [Sphingomonadaceae bacterium G21617-S1]|uniref:GNAT family N-acetyltransferase n=1 Tax=Rhizorhabdus sp. TaxID=1968843 RepID=UPI0012233297|nr:GNAT family N-acyltransferase [Rhizorhabdus sp.]MBD3760682.1 GNAT family N-acetyltransferase [Rhizorhabdus sp.]MCZ4342497.1 GNAT family N-acetyltransferase [Sphingomonadaceae bacterium G21617-S1]TAK06674.1 MAG: GNAT family N-acetyltransferase [Rhizorhabdus sp.]